tara:strand:- start:12 stop:392 length:381 start_codon:yes stop_codon:yes gene_type:complete
MNDKIIAEYQNCEYLENYDGDTVTVRINVWRDLPVVIKVRLFNLDTPEAGWRAKSEKEREMGAMAKLEAELLLSHAEHIVCRVYNIKEKFGRTLADLICDGQDVGEMLIAKGLARDYDGGKRTGWD